MGMNHTEDQAMLKDSVVPFLAENAPVKHLRALRDSNDQTGFARDLWKQFAEMGLNGILIPEAEGGLGLGHVEAGIVLEEIGRNLTPSPFLTTAVAAVEALKGAGAHLRGEWFPRIASGGAIIEERIRMPTTAYFRAAFKPLDPISPALPISVKSTGSWKHRPKARTNCMTSE